MIEVLSTDLMKTRGSVPLGLPITKGLFAGWSRKKEPFGLGWLRAGGSRQRDGAAWVQGWRCAQALGGEVFCRGAHKPSSLASELNQEEGL